MPDWRHAIERRLDGLRLPPAREAEVVEELAQHLDDRYAELREEGAADEAARRDALAELDDADLVGELTGAERQADTLPLGGGDGSGLLVGLWQDLRFGGRMFVKDAGIISVVVLTLSLAIAANAIVFGFTELLLLRPLPFANAARIVTIYGADHRQTTDRQGISIPDFLALKAQSATLDDVMAMRLGQVSFVDGGEPLAVRAAYGTANIFRLWGVSPAVGRLLLSGEDVAGRSQVAVLSHHFWAAHFASDVNTVGRPVTLNGQRYVVVGVMTAEIELGTLADIDLWVPLETSAAASREDRSLLVMGLLKPGATLGAANAELAAISDRLQRRDPLLDAGFAVRALSMRDATVGRSTWLILLLLAVVVGLVLLVACANIATVMLSRASARRREIAVRVALGATRGRLVRQFVAEGLLIGLVSGGIGVLLAYGGLAGFKALSMERYFQQLAINLPVLAFALTLSILAPVIFGVIPALESSRPNLNEDLKEGGRNAATSVRGNRSRATLLVAQVAFALAVLIVSGLVVRTARMVQQAPLGMNADGLLVTRVRFDPPKFTDDAARFRSVESILARLAETPGVTAAAATASFPVTDGEPTRQFEIAGHAAAGPGDAPWANEAAVYGDFLRACEIPLLEGRMWEADDRAVSWNVAVVNREAARRYWPSQSPVGAHITMLDASGRAFGPAIEVVGVIDNVIGAEPTEPAPPRVYRPLPLRPLAGIGLLVRTSSDAALMASPVREALRAADRDLAVSALRPARTQVDVYLRSWDLILAMFAGFAAIGLVVAVSGVYGLTAYSVGQRRHEIGVRMALGATAASVVRLIAARTFRLIGLGAVIGLAGGWAISLAMRRLLYGVGIADPATYGVVVALVTLCGLVATYIPASRVARIDPMTVLKVE